MNYSITTIFYFILISFGIMMPSYGFSETPKEVLSRLDKRKESFKKYINSRDKKIQGREILADNHRHKREEQDRQRKKNRQEFKRTSQGFPVKAYRQFVKNRSQKQQAREKARVHFQANRQLVKKVQQQKKYYINKSKAYDLSWD